MLFTHDLRVHQARVGIERVHRRVDAQLRNRTVENRRRVEVRKGRRGCGVGQVVRRHVDGLDRGDRARFGRGDALLHLAHVGRQRRLIAHSRRDTAKKRRHLGARLREAEDVVDEEQNVRPGCVAELFGQRQAGQGDTGTRARRLVHLAVDQRHLGFPQVVRLDHVGFDHLVVKVVALAGPLPNTGEHRIARVHLGDVVDQFHDENGLAHAGAAEQADLAALG